MYYALGHISRFLTPRSVRIGLVKPSDPFIEAVAVKLPSRENSNPIYDSLAVVILNRFVCTLYTYHSMQCIAQKNLFESSIGIISNSVSLSEDNISKSFL